MCDMYGWMLWSVVPESNRNACENRLAAPLKEGRDEILE